MKRHVLVVDDEPNICVAMRSVLERAGYRVTTASRGEAAPETAAEDVPDVVLLDIMMPGMAGRETCRMIRTLSAAAKVICATGKADAYSPSEAGELLAEAAIRCTFRVDVQWITRGTSTLSSDQAVGQSRWWFSRRTWLEVM